MKKKYHDNVIYQTRQHSLKIISKIFWRTILIALPLSIINFFVFKKYPLIISILTFLIITLLIVLTFVFFRKKSYFLITNYKVSIKVRNGFFSKYHMSLPFENIKDIAYSKNNALHYLFNFWTLFLRSSAGWDGDMIATQLPNIEKIYNYVNFIYTLPKEERIQMKFLDNNSLNNSYLKTKTNKQDIINEQIKILQQLKWIIEVKKLNEEDIKFIEENEEDRNHWIYETTRRDVVLCFTHDDNRRKANEPIVMKRWNKVIFPPVSFKEIKQKWTVSSSPSLKIHKYLIEKFNQINKKTATVLIGFDL